jgi:hypothetical protein
MMILPRRLYPPFPPGSLLKRSGLSVAIARQPSADRDPDYLALVRQCPCLRCGMDPAGTAAHLRLNSALHNKRQAMAKKPNDEWTTPLCAACHLNDADAQHKVGEAIFWERVGLNPFLVCKALYAQRGDLVAMRAVVVAAIAGRTRRVAP